MADFPLYKMNKKQPVPSSLSESVNRMFTPQYNSTSGTFASTKWYRELEADLQTGYLSLEYIHNNVHVGVNPTHCPAWQDAKIPFRTTLAAPELLAEIQASKDLDM
jgi:hypothetical protein